MDYDDFLELVKRRRSIRKFRPDPIPDENVDRIIEAARWAPSGANTQPWEFIVVREKDLKDGIVQIISEVMSQDLRMAAGQRPGQVPDRRRPHFSPSDIARAPVFILLIGDTRMRALMPLPMPSDWMWQLIFVSSLANAFMYMQLAATSLGLASRWLTIVNRPPVQSRLKKLLGVPAEMEVYDMMLVGYPDEEPRPKLVRNREEMVHYDYCREEDFRSIEKINEFINRLMNLLTMSPDIKQVK